jgi:hypothetical protein
MEVAINVMGQRDRKTRITACLGEPWGRQV